MMRCARSSRVMDAFDLFADHNELVAAETSNGVSFAYRGSDAGYGLDEELVADGVAEGVVDGLEPVKIDEQHAAHPTVSSNPGEGLIEPICEHQPVR